MCYREPSLVMKHKEKNHPEVRLLITSSVYKKDNRYLWMNRSKQNKKPEANGLKIRNIFT